MALAARDQLQGEGTGARVVSMPCAVPGMVQRPAGRVPHRGDPHAGREGRGRGRRAMGWRDYIGDAGEIAVHPVSATAALLFTK